MARKSYDSEPNGSIDRDADFLSLFRCCNDRSTVVVVAIAVAADRSATVVAAIADPEFRT